jgi:hypothetical protein
MPRVQTRVLTSRRLAALRFPDYAAFVTCRSSCAPGLECAALRLDGSRTKCHCFAFADVARRRAATGNRCRACMVVRSERKPRQSWSRRECVYSLPYHFREWYAVRTRGSISYLLVPPDGDMSDPGFPQSIISLHKRPCSSHKSQYSHVCRRVGCITSISSSYAPEDSKA